MYGAILGDIIGSLFEFDRGDKTKNFNLFSKGCGFTDDSVMTIAVGEALLAVRPKAAVKEIEDAVASNMQDWGKRYPHAGYGGSFRHWLKENNPKPYGSYGNGSAMRVSAAGWLYDSIERTREVARATANVTHNHPEGIKGAEATASAVYMARNGSSKEEIKEFKDAADVVNMLNKQSSLFGVSGLSSDMRDIEAGIQSHNPDAVLAYNIFIDRIKKFIGQYLAVLNGADAIIFTAGMGENAATMRNDVIAGLSWFGIELDPAKNVFGNYGDISTPESKVRVLVIPTDEELVIAREVERLK